MWIASILTTFAILIYCINLEYAIHFSLNDNFRVYSNEPILAQSPQAIYLNSFELTDLIKRR